MKDSATYARLGKLHASNRLLHRDLVYLLRHDELTGLLNRVTFISQTDKLLRQLSTTGAASAMIEIAVNGIPRISGQLGRHVGDYVVASIAARIWQHSLGCCFAGRLEYSGFAVFIPSISDPIDALVEAKSIVEILKVPIDWIDRKITLNVTAGIAVTDVIDNDALTLLQNTRLALDRASECEGPSYHFYSPILAEKQKRRADIVAALEEALERNYLVLLFQPVFATHGGELVGFEALMRIHHPKLGFISPAEFVPIAEEAGLISSLGRWALTEACRAAATWPSHLTVAVNVSPDQFYHGALLADIHHALALSSFPAYRLEIEITESTLLRDSELVFSQLNALREMGCSIVLDDFGTGYSSLSYLWKFAFTKLKIDRSFIQALESSTLVNGMLKSIVELSHGLGLKITAEGVETVDQADIVRNFGCDFIQGYLCGKPASENDLAPIILQEFSKQLSRNTQIDQENLPATLAAN